MRMTYIQDLKEILKAKFEGNSESQKKIVDLS